MRYYDGWWHDHIDDPFLISVYDDFKVFLALVWSHLGLPAPTPAQLRIADRLQGRHVPGEDPALGVADIIMAFRGIGKSYITAAFVLWRLLRNPRDEKILVVSASSPKAKEFVAQVKSVLMTMSLLEHLRPSEGQRNQADRFDVAGASISQSPSLKAAGITGQITGSRATLIVADDVEIPDNSRTEDARMLLLAKLNEFDAIAETAKYDDEGNLIAPKGDVVFLGTPQSLESIYRNLITTRGFGCFCIPARKPTADKRDNYLFRRQDGTVIDILDPYIDEMEGDWVPTDPKRFTEEDLRNRESRGRSWFLLQYMLDTSLSDAERYPLKQFDLMVMGTSKDKAPVTLSWGRHTDDKNLVKDVPNIGFSGDHLMRPLMVDPEWRPYDQSILWVDPAGRGADECAYAIIKALNGVLYVVEVGGHRGDVQEGMHLIATRAKEHDVRNIQIEPNYAAGVWIEAFRPVMHKVWPDGPGAEEGVWSNTQKEHRIIDTLEPVMNTHRLVIDEAALRADLKLASKDQAYSLIYQLTHITRDKGALKHDDRLDALAGGVSAMQRILGVDNQQSWENLKKEELDDLLEDFVASCIGDVSGRKVRRKGRTVEDAEVITIR